MNWTLTRQQARALLLHEIGAPAVTALRDLENGCDERSVLMRYKEAFLSPMLRSTFELAKRHRVIASPDVALAFPNLAPSTISNRLKQLEDHGLLVRLPQVLFINGGGRCFIYRPWYISQDKAEALLLQRKWRTGATENSFI